MITSNELRIGNWIFCSNPNEKGYPNNLQTQVGFEIFENLLLDEESFDDYSPIPLTPEILEKCGFVLDKGAGWWFLKGVEYGKQFPVADTINEGVKWVYNNSKNVHCKYLHQLQNLYFAITGEELPVNL